MSTSKKIGARGAPSTPPPTTVQPPTEEEKFFAMSIDDQINELFTTHIAEFEFDNQMLEGLAYNGFDPFIVVRAILARAKDLKSTIPDMLSDLTTVLIFLSLRGTNFEREDLEKRSKDANSVVTLRKLMKKWTIKKNPETSEDISVSRVAAVFPHIAGIVHMMIGKLRFGRVEGLPKEFHFAQAPCIMTADELIAHKEHWLTFMFNMQKAINRKGKIKNETQTALVTDYETFKISQEAIMEAMTTNDYTKAYQKAWRSQFEKTRSSADNEFAIVVLQPQSGVP